LDGIRLLVWVGVLLDLKIGFRFIVDSLISASYFLDDVVRSVIDVLVFYLLEDGLEPWTSIGYGFGDDPFPDCSLDCDNILLIRWIAHNDYNE